MLRKKSSQRSLAYRADIPLVADGIVRPRWSVMIPTHNCARYLRETLTSVLAQDPGPDVMQIEVVDDHSTKDDPEQVVAEIGGGRVSFFRQSENVGYIRNFETCLQRARGTLVHLLHGDDFVLDGFYDKINQAFEQSPEIGAAFCRHYYVDEEGHRLSSSLLEYSQSGILQRWLMKIASGQRIATPSIVVRRAVYERLGGFDRRMTCAGEDWEMWVRIAAHYPVWFDPEPLAAYRVKRDGALTEQAARSHRLVRDMRLATEIIESYLPRYLPAPAAHDLTQHARETYAKWALEGMSQAFGRGELVAASRQTYEALRCSTSRRTVRSVARLLAHEGKHWMQRKAGRVGPLVERNSADVVERGRLE
jgi:GT2 family glycosyltransferase